MTRSFRRAAALAAAVAAVALTSPAVAHADDGGSAPTDRVSESLVQIKTEVTGSVFIDMGADSVKEWSEPVSFTQVCTGVAVEDDRIITSASCVDPKSYHIASELRGDALADLAKRRGLERMADLYRSIGKGQSSWNIAADPQHPDTPATAVTTVRRVDGSGSGRVTGTLESSSYKTNEIGGLVGIVRLNSELDGLRGLPVSDSTATLGSRGFVAAPTQNEFAAATPKAVLVKTEITALPVDDGKQTAKFSGQIKPQYQGAPVVDEDGVMIGFIDTDIMMKGLDSATLHKYLASKGVEFASEDIDDGGLPVIVWLGPLLGVVAIAVIGAVVFVVVRKRRKQPTAGSYGAQPNPFGQQPFPFTQQPFPQQPHAPQPYAQQPHFQPQPGFGQQTHTPTTPPPTGQQAPSPDFDATQVVRRPDGPPSQT